MFGSLGSKLLADSSVTPPANSGAPATPLNPLQRLQNVGGQGGLNLADKPLSEIIGNIISAALGILGVVLLVLIVYAGYTWMTAEGEEKKVEKAKDTIKNSVIGLALVLAAYGITRLIVSLLGQAI